jgi:hypothetical protein
LKALLGQDVEQHGADYGGHREGGRHRDVPAFTQEQRGEEEDAQPEADLPGSAFFDGRRRETRRHSLAGAPPETRGSSAEAEDSSAEDPEEAIEKMQAFPYPQTEKRSDARAEDRLPEQATDRHAAQEAEGRGRA